MTMVRVPRAFDWACLPYRASRHANSRYHEPRRTGRRCPSAGRDDTMRFMRTSLLGLFGCLTFAAAAPAQEVSIGIVPSLMNDLTSGQQKFIRGEFPILVKEF